VIVSLPIEAEDHCPLLADATPLLIHDAAGVVLAIARAELGAVTLDETPTAPAPDSCRFFPRNTELEAIVMFAGNTLDPKLARLLVDGATLTVRQHHSFAALPSPGYRPRTRGWDSSTTFIVLRSRPPSNRLAAWSTRTLWRATDKRRPSS
jgi:hypothetical protein